MPKIMEISSGILKVSTEDVSLQHNGLVFSPPSIFEFTVDEPELVPRKVKSWVRPGTPARASDTWSDN